MPIRSKPHQDDEEEDYDEDDEEEGAFKYLMYN